MELDTSKTDFYTLFYIDVTNLALHENRDRMETHSLCVLHKARENDGLKYESYVELARGTEGEMLQALNSVVSGEKFRNRISKHRQHLRIWFIGDNDKPIESGGKHYNLATTKWYREKYGLK